MSFGLSTPVKVAALVGLLLASLAGAAAFSTMALHKRQAESVQLTPSHAKTAQHQAAVKFTTKPTPTPVKPKAPVIVDTNLPGPLRTALLHDKFVVAVLWAPGIAGDGDIVQAARQGAAGTHTGFTALNVAQESVATALAAWVPNAGDPAVLVVERPGRVVVELDGWVDQHMVAQAALDSR